MYYLSVAHVDGYMSDSAAAAVEEQITCLNASQINGGAAAGLSCRGTRNADAEVGKYGLGKSGTVCTVGQAGAAPYIGITHKLCREVYDLLTQ